MFLGYGIVGSALIDGAGRWSIDIPDVTSGYLVNVAAEQVDPAGTSLPPTGSLLLDSFVKVPPTVLTRSTSGGLTGLIGPGMSLYLRSGWLGIISETIPAGKDGICRFLPSTLPPGRWTLTAYITDPHRSCPRSKPE